MAEDRLLGRRSVCLGGNGWSTDCPKANVMYRLSVPGNLAVCTWEPTRRNKLVICVR